MWKPIIASFLPVLMAMLQSWLNKTPNPILKGMEPAEQQLLKDRLAKFDHECCKLADAICCPDHKPPAPAPAPGPIVKT